MAFTPDQHKVLKVFLHGTSSSSSSHAHNINYLITQIGNGRGIICNIPNSHRPKKFIIDTSAIDHICHTKDFFQCIKRINHMTIKLPNEALITTNYVGTIHFDKYLFIIDAF